MPPAIGYVLWLSLMSLLILKYSRFKGWKTIILYCLVIIHWQANVNTTELTTGLIIINFLLAVFGAMQFMRERV
jgi:hypothetical protein